MLLDQAKDDAEKLKERTELRTVYILRINRDKQRAERMEKTVAEYYNLDNRHTAERATWNKQQQEAKQQPCERTREYRKLASKLEKSTTCRTGFKTLRAMQHGTVESLYYYLCFLGGSYPQPNLTRLFRIGTTSPYHAIQDKHHKALMLNILEMILALAFRSLPEELMRRYSTAEIVTLQHSSINLNVLNPLHKGALQPDAVFLALKTETQGLRMEISMLEDFIKSWLWRRGFQDDEEIQELVNACRTSLSRALHLLYCVLRRQAPYLGSRIIKKGPNPITNIREYPVEIMDAVKRLVDEKCKKHWGITLQRLVMGNTKEGDSGLKGELYEDADECELDTEKVSWYPATDTGELENDDPSEDETQASDEETQNNHCPLVLRRFRAELTRKVLWAERAPRLLELDMVDASFDECLQNSQTLLLIVCESF